MSVLVTTWVFETHAAGSVSACSLSAKLDTRYMNLSEVHRIQCS